ncbi:hypothetical protein [Endobacterium cereale]|uniref:hypothetical protein n=1 Tax=Endobacterium cereale TaxID=2663029 RepID=UPI002B46AA5A|nr:hypothetical protein [Endobacterium cereale]
MVTRKGRGFEARTADAPQGVDAEVSSTLVATTGMQRRMPDEITAVYSTGVV